MCDKVSGQREGWVCWVRGGGGRRRFEGGDRWG